MPKRVLTGTVVSDKADKTVVVRVERRVKHPLYGKIIRLSKKYHAHDAANEVHVGEIVRIEECAPISKLKTWQVVDRIGSAKAAAVEIIETEALNPQAEPSRPAEKIEPKAEKPKAEKAAEPEDVKPAKPAKKPAKKAKAEDVADSDA
jgi:small subunit ribosomal protein S17